MASITREQNCFSDAERSSGEIKMSPCPLSGSGISKWTGVVARIMEKESGQERFACHLWPGIHYPARSVTTSGTSRGIAFRTVLSQACCAPSFFTEAFSRVAMDSSFVLIRRNAGPLQKHDRSGFGNGSETSCSHSQKRCLAALRSRAVRSNPRILRPVICRGLHPSWRLPEHVPLPSRAPAAVQFACTRMSESRTAQTKRPVLGSTKFVVNGRSSV